ncbi:hypothetical protein EU546_05810 [Candidatus Thorarchaeota archaeon]|nr:MAG: hypothetical protein EU546_05810 [Candidatus Thorarchaeota archaeon]
MEHLVRNLLGILRRSLVILLCGILLSSIIVYLPCMIFGCSPLSVMCVDPSFRLPFVHDLIGAMAEHYGLVAEPDVWNWIGILWATFSNSIHCDFGVSFLYAQPVSRLISERLPNTTLLLLMSSAIAGFSLKRLKSRQEEGLTARERNDTLGTSLPIFWISMMFLLIFSFMLPEWTMSLLEVEIGTPQFGTISYEVWQISRTSSLGAILITGDVLFHLALPSLVLSRFIFFSLSHLVRRKAKIERGESVVMTLGRHSEEVARVIPKIVSVLILVEVVFTWRGIGSLLFHSILITDTPTVLGVLVTIVSITVVGILVVEISGELCRWRLTDPNAQKASTQDHFNGEFAHAFRAYLLDRLPRTMDITQSIALRNVYQRRKGEESPPVVRDSL